MTISKSDYALIILTAIIVIMGIIMLRGYSSQIDLKAQKARLEQSVDSVSKLETSTRQAINAQQGLIKSLNDSIHGINERKSITDEKLKVSQHTVTGLAKEVRIAKIHKDTVAYYISCDSLVNEVDSLTSIQITKNLQYDSLGRFYTQIISRKDSIAQKQQFAYNALKGLFNSNLEDQEKCISDGIKLQKRANREKTLTRVVAGIATGLAVAFIIKK